MITITFASWMIPTAITVFGLVYALFIYDDGSSGYCSGIGNVFMLVPALAVSCISWMLWGIFK